MAVTMDQAAAQLRTLYQAVLGRDPDPAAVAVLVPELLSGIDPAVLRTQLAAGSTEAAAVVTGLYQAELGHGPDMAGLAASTAALGAGAVTVAGLAATLATSAEASIVIDGLYGQVLGRVAQPGERAQAQTALASGGSAATLRLQLAATPEAKATTGLLYQQVLGRNADPGGLSLYTASLGTTLSVSDIRAQLAASPEAQARLTTAYEVGFGRAPAPAIIAALDGSLARGQPFVFVTQVTARFESRHDATFNYAYGYAIPGQYSADGAPQFLTIYDSAASNANQSGFLSVPVALTRPATDPALGQPPGPDTIVINLQALGTAPAAFITATLDGGALGSATITAHPATQPFVPQTDNQVTFRGLFGPGLHDLQIQVADPVNGRVVIQDVATFNGNPFLLGSVITDASGVADVFPHAPN